MSGMRISGSYGGYGTITMPNGRVYDENSAQIKAMKRSGQIECSTCASRKYQDGSDEANVSFKSPGHISPSASMATVSAHEREHVANAYKSAAKDNGRVLQASVSYSRSICPECGRSYVSGGVTNTMVRYNEDNPYSRNAKEYDRAAGLVGSNIDYYV